MIQRIQSVYLFLASLAVASPLYLRSWVNVSSTGDPLFFWTIQLLAGLTALAGFTCLFTYNRRETQFKLTLVAQVLNLLLIIAIIGLLYTQNGLAGPTNRAFDFSTGVLVSLPVLAYILFYLARKAIKRDINLVKSMDRLR